MSARATWEFYPQQNAWMPTYRKRVVATVWTNGTWHTWDENGVGGENSNEKTVEEAKRQAGGSAILQGFI
jgi:hypothetical protein